jgi:hypothetical protein
MGPHTEDQSVNAVQRENSYLFENYTIRIYRPTRLAKCKISLLKQVLHTVPIGP